MRKTLLCLIAVLMTASVVYARHIAWDPTKKPRLSLEQALPVAQKALDADRKGFYCIGASLATTTSRDGDWTFTFASPRREYRYVVVDFDGGVKIHQTLVEY